MPRMNLRTKKMVHRPKVPESELQTAVCQFLDLALPAGAFYFSIPNEGLRSRWYGLRLRRMGLKRGMPDLVFLHAGRAYCIELKSQDGTVTGHQEDMHDEITRAGVPVAVCRTPEEVLTALRDWGFPLKQVRLAA